MFGQVTIYRGEAFSYLDRQTDPIWDAANALSISKTALAGAMAKERDAYARRWPVDPGLDLWAGTLLADHSVRENYYGLVQSLGIEDASDLFTKRKYPILMDVGLANFKFSTALRLLGKYNTEWYPTEDPLSLKQLYNSDYRRLLTDLLDEDSPATAQFYGLMIKEADAFFANNVNADYWNALSTEMKDALRITYTNFGQTLMVEKCLAGGGAGVWVPELGEGGESYYYYNVRGVATRIGAPDPGTSVPLPVALPPGTPPVRGILAGAEWRLDFQKGLTALAAEFYRRDCDQGGQKFIDAVTGGIKVNLPGVLDPTVLKGYGDLTSAARKVLAGEVDGLARLHLSQRDVWYLHTDDAQGMTVTGSGDTADLMLGGALADTLAGAGGQDVLFGGGGADTLNGGTGEDILIGGAGNDTLQGGAGSDRFVIGRDHDTITDGEATDFLETTIGRRIGGYFRQESGGGYVWDGDATVQATRSGNDLTITLGGGTQVTIQNFDDGDLDIHLIGDPNLTVPQTTLMIAGDLTPIDTDPNEPGVQLGYDALGNVLTNSTPWPDRADTLFGSAGNDLIQSGGGDDEVHDWRGGDDRIEAGAGADWVDAGDGNNVLLGGAGLDILYAGHGNDAVYADTEIALETAIAQGETDPPTGSQGEFLDSHEGDDLVVGSAGNDALLAGGGTDVVVGGAGDDLILGDGTSGWYVVGWSLTRSVQNGVYSYTFTPSPLDVEDLNPSDDTLYGGAGNDWIFGGPGADLLDGGSGDDVLFGDGSAHLLEGREPGAGGDDMLLGGAGNDALLGFDGADYLDGGDGDDQLYGDSSDTPVANQGDDYLDGGAGNDTLRGQGGDDTLFGGTGNDTLIGDDVDIQTGGADYLDGEAGSDTLVGAGGDDTLFGGEDNDQLFGDGDDVALADQGDDYLDGEAGNDTLRGYAGNDVLVGGEGADTLLGEDGADALDGGAGDDQLYGGAGDDVLTDEAGTNVLVGGAGSDDLYGGSNTDQLFGDASDVLEADQGDDYLDGGAGDDYLKGYGGNDTLFGGDGADTLLGDAGDDVLDGEAGNDTLWGGIGTDELYGGDGVDELYGEAGDDLLDGGAGGNVLVGGAGSDVLLGGDDADQLDADGSDVPVLHQGDDFVDGGGGDDTIWGHGGNDVLYGGAGADSISAGPGNDYVDGGTGADTCWGEAGDDTFVVDDVNDVVVEYTNEGIDTVESSVSYALPDHVEYLTLTGTAVIDGTGNTLANTIRGNAAANRLDGGGGAGWDTLIGGAGDDTYVMRSGGWGAHIIEEADEGIDTVETAYDFTLVNNVGVERLVLTGTSPVSLQGNNLDNVLIGNAAANHLYDQWGDDRLDGGAGADTMAGGARNDTYVVDNPGDIVIENYYEGTDTVEASISYSLPAYVENLLLTGAGALTGTGNAENNILLGNDAGNVLSGGSAGNDRLDGGGGADTMTGGTGEDTYVVQDAGDVVTENVDEGWADTVESAINYTLPANVENLTLTGTADLTGTGNALSNVLRGNAGTDTLRGGPGHDEYWVDNAGDVVVENADEGLDSVWASVSYTLAENVEDLYFTGTADLAGTGNALDNALNGNSGANTLAGGAGNDYLWGDTGNDRLDGGLGGDEMEGAQGNDTYVVDNASDLVTENASEGTDTVESYITYTLGSNLENLTLLGTNPINGTGNSGANVLRGNSAANTLTGGAGNDTYYVSTGDTISDSAGTDTVYADITWSLASGLENLTLLGSANLNATGNTAANLLTGNSGTNTLTGLAGNDTYVIGAGDTVVEASGAGTDTVQTDSTYTLGANVENLTLLGSANLNATGNTLNNVLTGNSGNNTLSGGTGNDTMRGGAGDDTYVVDAAADVVTENANEGTDLVQAGVTYTLAANVENLTLTGSSNLNGTGNTGNNLLTGNSGTNTLTGLAGDDTYVIGAGDTVVEAAGGGTDTVQSSITYTLAANVENLVLTGSSNLNGTGNTLNNVLTGNSGTNTLTGLAGDDTYVIGTGDTVVEAVGAGTDTVQTDITYTLGSNVENLTLTGSSNLNGTGNTLHNLLTGNSGNNVLTGVDGNDTLGGGQGTDTLVGGLGNDTYQFARGDGQDTIQENDSTPGNSDTLLFGATINPMDLVLSQQGNDLRLSLHGTTDQVTVQGWYTGTAAQTETLQAGNGQHLLNTQVDQLIQAMAAFSAQTGLTWDQAIDQRPQEVQTILVASWA